MFDRPGSGERALLVHVEFRADSDHEDLEELRGLAVAAGATVTAEVTGARAAPDPRYFVGRGKAEEILSVVNTTETDLVIVNHSLSPAQERNLESLLSCRVIDRTGLILDIFAQRASTFEGKLQVELAQLRHLASRLVRGWTHLERQKGGIGLRGPGEKQLETDRRLLGDRIRQIGRRLERVRKRRELSRRARRRADLPVISLVGYTNAGKSSVFNRLTGASVLIADQPFATLDPTLRRWALPHTGNAVLADTVGFIRHLPHELVAAFRATLEETRAADLLLHVVDAGLAEQRQRMDQVDAVLEEIGAHELPCLRVFNKIDATDDPLPGVDRDEYGRPTAVRISAHTGAGLDLLVGAVDELVGVTRTVSRLRIAPGRGRLRARLFELGEVVHEESEDNGDWLMEVIISPDWLARVCRDEGLDSKHLAA